MSHQYPNNSLLTRRQLLGLKEIPAPKKYTIEKWSGGRVNIIEMSDDRIRESREVEAGQRLNPVNAPAAGETKTTAIPSGVSLPAFAVTAEAVR